MKKGSRFFEMPKAMHPKETSTDGMKKTINLSSTFRVDKNENFNFLFSPAISIVYKPNKQDIIRLSFSSAIRNPTLSDQYLFYNTGRAILIGNLSGHGSDDGPHFDNSKENMVTVESLNNYFLYRDTVSG